MAQTVKIANATYPGVPALRVGTPTVSTYAWFLDATTLLFDVDTNGDIQPLEDGFVFGASDGDIVPRTLRIAGAVYSGVPALKIGTPSNSDAWFIDSSALKFEVDSNGNITPLASGDVAIEDCFELDSDGNIVPIG